MAGRLPALLPRRAGRRTNVGVLVLLLLAGATGVLAFGVGTTEPSRWVVAAHGAAGLGLLLLVPWKAVVVRRALRRTPRLPGTSVALGLLVLITVVTGVVHSAGATGPSQWSLGLPVLHLHVAAAAFSAVMLAAHAWGRRQRPSRTDLGRRALLRTGGIAAGAAGLWVAAEGLLRLTGAPGAERRVTGSFERGTDDPSAMPVTQWFTDTVPEAAAGALVVAGNGRRVEVPVDDLDRGDSVRAVLDCTGGWFAAQDWRGVRLDRLLAEHLGDDLPADGSVDVVSITGYRRRLPMRDAGALLLATSAAGRPLSPGHGAPVRLVAPGRRGFWWVKWVRRVEVTDRPWWAQVPFPLQ